MTKYFYIAMILWAATWSACSVASARPPKSETPVNLTVTLDNREIGENSHLRILRKGDYIRGHEITDDSPTALLQAGDVLQAHSLNQIQFGDASPPTLTVTEKHIKEGAIIWNVVLPKPSLRASIHFLVKGKEIVVPDGCYLNIMQWQPQKVRRQLSKKELQAEKRHPPRRKKPRPKSYSARTINGEAFLYCLSTDNYVFYRAVDLSTNTRYYSRHCVRIVAGKPTTAAITFVPENEYKHPFVVTVVDQFLKPYTQGSVTFGAGTKYLQTVQVDENGRAVFTKLPWRRHLHNSFFEFCSSGTACTNQGTARVDAQSTESTTMQVHRHSLLQLKPIGPDGKPVNASIWPGHRPDTNVISKIARDCRRNISYNQYNFERTISSGPDATRLWWVAKYTDPQGTIYQGFVAGDYKKSQTVSIPMKPTRPIHVEVAIDRTAIDKHIRTVSGGEWQDMLWIGGIYFVDMKTKQILYARTLEKWDSNLKTKKREHKERTRTSTLLSVGSTYDVYANAWYARYLHQKPKRKTVVRSSSLLLPIGQLSVTKDTLENSVQEFNAIFRLKDMLLRADLQQKMFPQWMDMEWLKKEQSTFRILHRPPIGKGPTSQPTTQPTH